MCLACLGNIEEEAVPCSHCSWHFCKLCAQEGARGGHQQECRIFQEAELKPGDEGSEHLFPIITILRVLLLKTEDNGDKWRQVEKLMDNWEEFKKDASLVEELSKVTNFLKEKMNLDWVDERSVARAYGVMKTNAMALKDEGGQALFPIASLMSHSCVSNLEPLDEPGITIAFRAKRNIKEGEELTIRYAMFLQPRDQIQEALFNSYHFLCACPRCSQVSELGTNFSSLQCPCGGFFSSRLSQGSENHRCSLCGDNVDLTIRLTRVTELSLKIAELGATPEVSDTHSSPFVQVVQVLQVVPVVHVVQGGGGNRQAGRLPSQLPPPPSALPRLPC